jgi:hypothetical protein
MAKIKLADGKMVADGDEVTLILWSAEHRNAVSGQQETIEKTAHGIVHSFEQVDRVYDNEGIATGKTSETRWELLTGDPAYPAIGFLPESVKTKTEK